MRKNKKKGKEKGKKDQSRPASAEGPSTPAAAAQGSAVALSRIQSPVSPAVEELDEAGGTSQAGKQSKKARKKQQQKAAAAEAAAAVAQAEAAAQQQQEDARVQQVREPVLGISSIMCFCNHSAAACVVASTGTRKATAGAC